MKKWIAGITATILLLSVTVFGVCAEDFSFREISREWFSQNESEYSFFVKWNTSDNVQIEDVIIGGKSCNFKVDTLQDIVVDITALPAGVYPSVTYQYVADLKQGEFVSQIPLVKKGTSAVKLSAAFNADGSVTVTATGDNGLPVPNYTLKLTVGRMANINGTTDTAGKYRSPYTAAEGEEAVFEGVATEYQGVQYTAAAAAKIARPITATTTVPTTTIPTTVNNATTTEEETTVTTIDTTNGTVPPDVVLPVRGNGTTAKLDNNIALNVSTDTRILQLFGVNRTAFDNHARLILSQDSYSGIVGRTSNILMLNVLSVEQQASHSALQEALEQSSFADYSKKEWNPLTFNLSLLMLDRTGNTVPVTAAPQDVQYTVELPVPESMKDCSTWAITTVDGEKFMEPQPLTVTDGCFRIQTNSMGDYTIIAFPAEANEKAGGISWWLVLLLIAGILLLGGAGVLLYFFVLRKPELQSEAEQTPVSSEPENDIPVFPDNENDIFSGRTDIDMFPTPKNNNEQE